MSKPLSNTQEIIERSIFEAIRLKLVDKGYLPDILLYPDNPEGLTQYETALTNIINSKGFAIDIFSGGTNFNKGIKKLPRIVLNPGSFMEGEIGSDTFKYFQKNGLGKFDLVTQSDIVNYYLEIHLVSETLEQERILNAILSNTLGRRKYVKVYNDTSTSFLVRYLNYYNGDDTDQGVTEKVFSYEVPDCYDGDVTILNYNVSPISLIDLNINLKNYYNGELLEKLTVYDTLHVKVNTSSSVVATINGVE